jgi:hypothetical protein
VNRGAVKKDQGEQGRIECTFGILAVSLVIAEIEARSAEKSCLLLFVTAEGNEEIV